ncbi:MAG: hypothetical protein KBD82_03005 [Rhodoferax sp.]|uniref:hypothetical protein n=1 Tax=Rhodoferax sp. TaxID=50421 RepID=UPI001B4B35FB|nr:hypothetical protein [Rhodoferax sp.]MBP9734605.1 hypothetical protein [Rhodoferax sp.]
MTTKQTRCRLLIAIISITVGGAFGQTFGIAEQRQQIAKARAQQVLKQQEQERICYTKFAVTDCLRELRSQHRSVLNDLRRQEMILNDMDRQSKAVQALQRLESKSTPPAELHLGPASDGQSPLR